MPKLNKTMLDELASIMKTYGGKKPAIIQETAWQDPLSGSIVGRKVASLTPTRKRYQEDIERRNQRIPHYPPDDARRGGYEQPLPYYPGRDAAPRQRTLEYDFDRDYDPYGYEELL